MARQPRPEVEEPESEPAVANEDRVSRRDRVRRSRFKFRRPDILIPLTAVVIAGAAILWLFFASYESTDDAQVDVHLYPMSARIS